MKSYWFSNKIHAAFAENTWMDAATVASCFTSLFLLENKKNPALFKHILALKLELHTTDPFN